MQKPLFLLPLLLLVMGGCDLLGQGDGDAPYTFRTDRPRFATADGVGATFTNVSGRMLYLSNGSCAGVSLERREGSVWRPVPPGLLCTAELRPPAPVKAGSGVRITLGAWLVSDTRVAPGTYRLVLLASGSKEGDYESATSNVFEILGEENAAE